MIARSSYSSQSADEAWDALSRMYTHARPHRSSPDARISFDSLVTPELSIDRGYLHTAGGSFAPSPDQLNVITVLGGRIGLDFRRRGSVENGAADSYLYLPECSADLEWHDFGALALRLPTDLVAEVGALQTGLPVDALRFLDPRPVSPAHARLWRFTAENLWRDLSSMRSQGYSRMRYLSALNLTVSALIAVFPNTAMTRGYVPGPGRVEPPALRRAVAYIEAHASLPITVLDIADAAGTSPPALRAAFRRHLDTTPTAHLREVRLRGAHQELEAATSGTSESIAAVAARWGFGSRATFDKHYQAQYGTTPWRTLTT